MIVQVDAAFGPDDTPRPRAVRLGRRIVPLREVLDVWPGADHTYVKVRAEDGTLYILRHDVSRDLWQLTLYQAPSAPPTQEPET